MQALKDGKQVSKKWTRWLEAVFAANCSDCNHPRDVCKVCILWFIQWDQNGLLSLHGALEDGAQLSALEDGEQLQGFEDREQVQVLEDGAQVPVLKDGEQVQGLEDGEQVQVLEDGEQVQELDEVPLQGHQNGPGWELQEHKTFYNCKSQNMRVG